MATWRLRVSMRTGVELECLALDSARPSHLISSHSCNPAGVICSLSVVVADRGRSSSGYGEVRLVGLIVQDRSH